MFVTKIAIICAPVCSTTSSTLPMRRGNHKVNVYSLVVGASTSVNVTMCSDLVTGPGLTGKNLFNINIKSTTRASGVF